MTTVSDGLFQYGGAPVGTYGNTPIPRPGGSVWFVDGDNGLDGNSGRKPETAFKTIGAAATSTNAELKEGDTIYVFAKTYTTSATDPASYAETIIITTPQISIIGVGNSRTQGGLPQMKIGGSSTTSMITIRAGGVTIANMGINGASSTGGGIEIDQNAAGSEVIGTAILNCHFKNCKKHATNGGLGGAINWSVDGGGWQTLIKGNRFYKCLADIVVIGTSNTVPQDVVIEENVFSGPAANVDINIKTGGSGVNGLIIHNNVFQCLPAIGSGSNAINLDLTGSVGVLSQNHFGCAGETFGAAADSLVPTTVMICGNYQDNALIGRT